MDAIQRKERLHLRIEQANEDLQIVLDKMVEALFQTYQPEAIADKMAKPKLSRSEYEATLKPMTKAELVARARASNEDIAAGRIHSLAEVDEMFGL